MNKLSRRIDKLFVKTHIYISLKDCSLIRDYNKALLDEANINPLDFQEECNEIGKLTIEWEKDKSIDYLAKRDEIAKGNYLILYAFFYQCAKFLCESYPNGHWFPKKKVQHLLPLIEEAKEYFDRKKKFDS